MREKTKEIMLIKNTKKKTRRQIGQTAISSLLPTIEIVKRDGHNCCSKEACKEDFTIFLFFSVYLCFVNKLFRICGTFVALTDNLLYTGHVVGFHVVGMELSVFWLDNRVDRTADQIARQSKREHLERRRICHLNYSVFTCHDDLVRSVNKTLLLRMPFLSFLILSGLSCASLSTMLINSLSPSLPSASLSLAFPFF